MDISHTIVSIAILDSFVLDSKAQETKDYRLTTLINLQHTEIKNQQNTGTRWNYCIVSFIESELLRMGRQAPNL